MQEVSALLQAARHASSQGQHDKAARVLTAFLEKAPQIPLGWFTLAGIYAKQGRHDLAALSFHKASVQFEEGKSRSPQALRTAQVARDNMLLSTDKALTDKEWLAALNDPATSEAWACALDMLAQQLMAPTLTPTGTKRGPTQMHVCVAGGLGIHALYLQHRLGEQLAASPLAASAEGVLVNHVSVTAAFNDELSKQLASQLAAAVPFQSSFCSLKVTGTHTAFQHRAEAENANQLAQQVVDMLVTVDCCLAQLAFTKWASFLQQAAPSLASHALLCPMSVAVKGMLVCSEDIWLQNQVDLAAMEEDTGLQYGSCNELLYRPFRHMHVAAFKHTCLSQPTELLSISAKEVLQQGTQMLHHSCSIPLLASASGRADCVVVWVEWTLAPGVVLPFAPPSAGGTPDPHTLRPHAWQRVHYLPARPTVQTGQTLVLDVRLKGDELRIEADEDVPCMVLGPTGCASKPGTACGTYGLEGLPVGESLPAGEALDSEDTITAGNSSHDNDAVGGQGVGRRQHHSSGTSSSSSVHDVEEGAMGGLILPYHMSMLNDRSRTLQYRDGIRGAVRQLLSHKQSLPESHLARSLPPVVLDVGTGSGLLSMIAAKAGAPCIVGCEREPTLALTAATLTAVNDCRTVRVVQALSTDLTVAQPTALPQPDCLGQPSSIEQPQHPMDGIPGVSTGLLAAARGNELPAQASLVLHEIFGTDPLSEHILPTMRHVQECLAAPDAVYMPGYFSVVAALASSKQLYNRLYRPSLGCSQEECRSSPSGHAAADCSKCATAGLGLPHLGQAARDVLQPWAPWKVEVDALTIPDMLLLTKPARIITWHLGAQPQRTTQAHRSSKDGLANSGTGDNSSGSGNAPAAVAVPLSLEGEAQVCLQCISPLHVAEWCRQEAAYQVTGHAAGNVELIEAASGTLGTAGMHRQDDAVAAQAGSQGQHAEAIDCNPEAHCVLYWFEADCGEGGVLSTAPGKTRFGHWVQNVELLPRPLQLQPAQASPHVRSDDRGIASGHAGAGLSEPSERMHGLPNFQHIAPQGDNEQSSAKPSLRLRVRYMVDRLKFNLEL